MISALKSSWKPITKVGSLRPEQPISLDDNNNGQSPDESLLTGDTLAPLRTSVHGWVQAKPSVSTRRISTIHESATKVIEQDPWKHSRIDWLNVLINLGTYFLMMTDIPRAGAVTQLNMRPLADGLYSWFGSFAYEVITFTRDPLNMENVTATRHNSPVDHARTWSYTFDTTSVELRTITSMLNSSTSSHVLNCMNYKISCNAAGSFSIPETFTMLDQVVHVIASVPESALPSIYPRNPGHDYQYLRLAKRVKSRHVYILYDKLVEWFLYPTQMRSVRMSHWPSIDASLDVCADLRDRPFLCDAGEISDYRFSADPTDAESANVSYIWVSINDHARATYAAFPNHTNNIKIDITILEGYTEPLTYVGGSVMVVSAEFEIVVVTRVRDCSTNADNSLNHEAESCRTIRLTDYRYEGGTATTDLGDWSFLIWSLRVFAQLYYIIRVVSLLVGCYFAFPKAVQSLERALFVFLSEVPAHVVAYGSFIPITMYTLASMMDGPIISAIIHSGGLGLQGNFIQDPGRIYTLICLLMRKQWLMAFLTLLWVRLQSMTGYFNRHDGIVSFRGHVFGLLASLSMILGYYNPNFRDTRVLGYTEAGAETSVVKTRTKARDFANQRLSGVYSDLCSIVFSVVMYIVLVLMIRTLLRTAWQIFAGVRTKMSSFGDNSKRHIRTDSRIIGNRSFFFSRTELLPSTFSTLWSVDGLTCGWSNDALFSTAAAGGRYRSTVAEHTKRAIVMNIVQLSEPWNILCLRLGLNRPTVYTYLVTATQSTFSLVNSLNADPIFTKNNFQSGGLQTISSRSANDLSFSELVRCR